MHKTAQRLESIHAPAIAATPLLSDERAIRIIIALTEERMRFSALESMLGMSPKTLSHRLKQLTSQGLVTRTLYAQIPVKVEYELTEKGREFVELLLAIDAWQSKWR
jgi:DNA-binding HxlR family transcriptional regulator